MGCIMRVQRRPGLRILDTRRQEILPLLTQAYGSPNAARWFVRWRLFFLACAELFGYRRGHEWWVSHYLFRRRPGGL